MSNLLTTRQLQELLQLDRTTIYRMLKDGRLSGVKVGNQWRFPRQNVASLLAEAPPPSAPAVSGRLATDPPSLAQIIPCNCIQSLQNVFAEVAGVGALTLTSAGQPVTKMSNSCSFCNSILASAGGREACLTSWRKLANDPEQPPKFFTCHAGLQYARARINVNQKFQGLFVAGQFYTTLPDPTKEKARLSRLAQAFQLDLPALLEAAQELPALEARNLNRVQGWLESVARTIEQIGCERAELVGRLQHIAEVSTLPPA